jgi:hypothetical protein
MGIFMAPRSGLYVFTWTVQANGGSYFNTQLLVNGLIYGSIYTRDASYANSNAGTAVVSHTFMRVWQSTFELVPLVTAEVYRAAMTDIQHSLDGQSIDCN